MKGMILAAGLGARLGALTKDKPKALVEVDSRRTMLDVVVDRLKGCGVTQLIINLHYKGELIREYVLKQRNFGIDVLFSEEPNILGTGGGIRNVEAFFRDCPKFIVHNCDVYSDVDLDAMLRKHSESRAAATLAVLQQKQESYLLFDSDNRLVGWEMADGGKRNLARNVSNAQRLCYTGIQVLSPEIFEYMRDEAPNFPIVSTYVKVARAGRLVQGFPLQANYWLDVGTVERLQELRQRLS